MPLSAHMVVLGALLFSLIWPTGYADAADALLTGKRLSLTPGRLSLLSRDPAIGLGGGENSADDPVLNGGSIRVLSIEGDVFDTTYTLPGTGWSRVRDSNGVLTGYVFRGTGEIRLVHIRAGERIKVRARGSLGHTLGGNPAPVRVTLTLGALQYCLSFGGTVSARAGRRYLATDAPAPGACPIPYGEDQAWACRPGIVDNECFTHDLDATEIAPDLTETVQPFTGNENQPYDCFYIFPTVALFGTPANVNYLSPSFRNFVLDPLLSQAAPFTDRCRVFAPYYRQVSLGTYGSPNAQQFFDFAYRDVLDAWRLYLRYHNGGRNVVIMGHSQGTQHLTRLMQDEVDPDPARRAQLIVALLIGFSVGVPPGQTIGGTFQDIPVCTSPSETGCVIAYRTWEENHPPTNGANGANGGEFSPPPGMDNACTNPGALAGGEAYLDTYFPTIVNNPAFAVGSNPGITTYFARLRNFYAGECVLDDTGHTYLQIRMRPQVGDQRTNPIDFDHVTLSPARLGTHILDYAFPLGELKSLVATKAAAMP